MSEQLQALEFKLLTEEELSELKRIPRTGRAVPNDVWDRLIAQARYGLHKALRPNAPVPSTPGPIEPDAHEEPTPPDVPWHEFERVMDERDKAEEERDRLGVRVQDLEHWLQSAYIVMERAARPENRTGDDTHFWAEQGLGGNTIINSRLALIGFSRERAK